MKNLKQGLFIFSPGGCVKETRQVPRHSGSGSPYSISWISGDSILAYGLLGAGLRKIFHSAYFILVCVKVERKLEYRHEYVSARVCMSDPEEETKRGYLA